MSVAVRAFTSTQSTGASPTGALPAGTTTGDVLVATCINNNAQGWNTAPGGGWTQITGYSGGAGGGISFRKIAGASEPATWTFPITGGAGFLSNSNIVITAISGADTTTPIADSNSVDNAASTTAVLPSVTATNGATYLMQIVALYSADTVTKPGSQTVEFNSIASGSRAYGASETVGSGATGTRTYTIGASVAGAATILAINPATLTQSATVAETVTISATAGTSTTATRATTATLTATGTGTSTGDRAETVTLTSTGQTSGTADRPVTITLTASGTLTGSGVAARDTTVTLTAVGNMSATGSGPVSETVTITATGKTTDMSVVASVVTLTADGYVYTPVGPVRPLVIGQTSIRELLPTDVLVGLPRSSGFYQGGG